MTQCGSKTITVSAPGKVLLTGGYLVLERANSGAVLGATARFYSTAKLSLLDDATAGIVEGLPLLVESPQFHSNYSYDCVWTDSDSVPRLKILNPGQPSNPYVENTIMYVMAFLRESLGHGHLEHVIKDMTSKHHALCLKLRADNDFYSQVDQMQARELPVGAESLASLPPFLPCPKRDDGTVIIAKTGMGSSAALITSLVGCLLSYFGGIEESAGDGAVDHGKGGPDFSPVALRLVHNLAQVCHGVAQGKVGSGFDVSAAVYGSHVYRRFSPEIITPILSADTTKKGLPRDLKAVVESEWDSERQYFALPKTFCLLMGDVRGGSSTPSMVRKVLEWKKAPATATEAEALWQDLARVNGNVVALMAKLVEASREQEEEFVSCTSALALLPAEHWKSTDSCAAAIPDTLVELRGAFVQARRLLKTMGDLADVPIEPEEQTRLADATARLSGVLCAGVPGAGGVDAIYAITISSSVTKDVQALWASWCSAPATNTVCPLLLNASTKGLCRHDDMAWQ